MIGIKRYEQAAACWIKAYRKDGIVGLKDTRSEDSGRPSTKPLSKDTIIARQEDKIRLLEEQIALLNHYDSQSS